MRVAHCIHGLGLGGAQEVIRQIVAGRRGELTYFVYTCEGGALLPRLEAAGARVRVLPRRLPKLDPGWVARLARAMRADGIDVVHTHLFGDSLHGYLAAQAAGALPVVMTLHSERTLLSRLQQAGYRWLLARAGQVVACGDSVCASYRGWRTAQPMRTVANGIAVPPLPAAGPAAVARLRAELGLPATALTFATVGRLVALKGHRFLIAALAQALPALPGPVRLAVLGDGPLAPELRARAAAAGLGEQVVFAGSRDDVARLLPAFDVVVFSSVSEGLPMALLEAMAAGRCIVASGLPGIVEAVRPDGEALIVRPAAAGELAAALQRAAAEPGLRERLGQAARRRFLAAYTGPRMVASYEAIYRETWRRSRRYGPRAVVPAA
ncbi:MAG TPA: glycosyltransferase [Thermoanaerobaculia bacterium]|nr:glycosyltransferase [Thermoanaerobaculia bacterium]